MSQKLSLKQLKSRVDGIESYLDAHPAFQNIAEWPMPGHREYWPVRWIMEYLHIIKNEYYRTSARQKKFKKKK